MFSIWQKLYILTLSISPAIIILGSKFLNEGKFPFPITNVSLICINGICLHLLYFLHVRINSIKSWLSRADWLNLTCLRLFLLDWRVMFSCFYCNERSFQVLLLQGLFKGYCFVTDCWRVGIAFPCLRQQ